MMEMRLYLQLCAVLLLVFTVGCQTTETTKEEPFIFTYTFKSMENEDSEILNEWLSNARADKGTNIHSFEMENGYLYPFITMQEDIVMY